MRFSRERREKNFIFHKLPAFFVALMFGNNTDFDILVKLKISSSVNTQVIYLSHVCVCVFMLFLDINRDTVNVKDRIYYIHLRSAYCSFTVSSFI